jgi:hypothetical protein
MLSELFITAHTVPNNGSASAAVTKFSAVDFAFAAVDSQLNTRQKMKVDNTFLVTL